MSSHYWTSLLRGTKSAPPIMSTGPLSWVGLSGLEPLTSSLSGQTAAAGCRLGAVLYRVDLRVLAVRRRAVTPTSDLLLTFC